jgi:hypothetical protein
VNLAAMLLYFKDFVLLWLKVNDAGTQVKLSFDSALGDLETSLSADIDAILRYSKDFVLLWLTGE